MSQSYFPFGVAPTQPYHERNKAKCSQKRMAYYWANQEKERERQKKYYKEKKVHILEQKRLSRHGIKPPKERIKKTGEPATYYMKYKFGMSRGEYDKMLQSQSGVCAICGAPPNPKRRLAIDHCHKSGAIRGLLCVACNTALGAFKENIKTIENAIVYLNRTVPNKVHA